MSAITLLSSFYLYIPSPFLYIHPLSCLWLILPGLFKSCLGTGALEGAGRPSPLPCLPLLRPCRVQTLLEVSDAWVRVYTAGGKVSVGEGTTIPGGGVGVGCHDMECLCASFSVLWWGEVCLSCLCRGAGRPWESLGITPQL